MKSVVVISATEPDFSHMCEAYGEIGSTDMESPRRLVVEGDWGWFAIGIDDGIEREFSDTEHARIARLIAKPNYAQLEYSSSSAAELAINLMPTTSETLIDNDHGMLRPIEVVRDLIRAKMEWQTA